MFWYADDVRDHAPEVILSSHARDRHVERRGWYIVPLGHREDRQSEIAKRLAEEKRKPKLPILALNETKWFDAEDYHQNYYQSDERILSRFGLVKKKDAYKGYRKGCGRDARVKAVWGAEAYKGLPVAAH